MIANFSLRLYITVGYANDPLFNNRSRLHRIKKDLYDKMASKIGHKFSVTNSSFLPILFMLFAQKLVPICMQSLSPCGAHETQYGSIGDQGPISAIALCPIRHSLSFLHLWAMEMEKGGG